MATVRPPQVIWSTPGVDLDPAAHHLAEALGRDRVAHRLPLDERQGHVHPAGLAVGGVEPMGRERRQELALRVQAVGGPVPGGRVHPAVHPLGQPTPAVSFSSAMDDGGPRTANSSRNESSSPRKGRSILPLRLASPAWHALISVPWWTANSRSEDAG